MGGPTTEPPLIANIAATVAPLARALSLCGAGGGGFMLVLTKEPHAGDAVQAALDAAGGGGVAGAGGSERPVVYGVSVATDGLTIERSPPP